MGRKCVSAKSEAIQTYPLTRCPIRCPEPDTTMPNMAILRQTLMRLRSANRRWLPGHSPTNTVLRELPIEADRRRLIG